jgi:hypothetical protein
MGKEVGFGMTFEQWSNEWDSIMKLLETMIERNVPQRFIGEQIFKLNQHTIKYNTKWNRGE